VEFRLLGAVEAAIGEKGIRLGPPRHKFVLAVLAMEANRTVPIDRLVELSWPDSPPRTASHAIQVAVSRIRSTLANAGATHYQVSVQTYGQGYRLEVDPMRIDTHRFRALRGLQVAVLRHDPALVLSAAKDSAAPAVDEITLALLKRISQRLPSAAPFAAKQVRRLLSVVDELLTEH
jgi:DNA-binding winged helix-turn-helix (wHTH) protein